MRNDQAIDQGVESLLKVQIEQGLGGGKLDNLPVLVETIESPRAQLGEPLLECVTGQGGVYCGLCFLFPFGFCFGLGHNSGFYGKQRVEAGVLAQRQDAGGDFVYGVALDDSATDDAMGSAAAGKEQTQIIVNLRRRRDSRPRIAGGVLLLDGNGRCNAVDQVDIRLFDAFQKLPRIRGQRFDVSPLPFRINGVKSELGLPRTRNPGDHGQLAVGQIAVDVFEIVGPCTTDGDSIVQCLNRRARRGPPRWALLSLFQTRL